MIFLKFLSLYEKKPKHRVPATEKGTEIKLKTATDLDVIPYAVKASLIINL